MDESQFDWDDLRLFLAVARHGGLAGAMAPTGKSAPTLGRRILALERRLGQELFRRMPRGYALTADGQRLLDLAQALEHRITPVMRGAAERAPLVKVSAGVWVTHLLCQHTARLAGAGVRLRFIAADEVVDIGHREAVIGIRNQRPTQTALAGRRLNTVQFAVYAADPSVTVWARVVGTTPSARWVTMQDGAAIEVTSPRNALDLALAGAVRAVLPCFIGDRQTGLTRCSAPIDDLAHEQWLVTHHEDRFLPEVRRVIDRLHALLKAEVR